jgi:hypothetical protein
MVQPQNTKATLLDLLHNFGHMTGSIIQILVYTSCSVKYAGNIARSATQL